jgi:hypothetical protein
MWQIEHISKPRESCLIILDIRLLKMRLIDILTDAVCILSQSSSGELTVLLLLFVYTAVVFIDKEGGHGGSVF